MTNKNSSGRNSAQIIHTLNVVGIDAKADTDAYNFAEEICGEHILRSSDLPYLQSAVLARKDWQEALKSRANAGVQGGSFEAAIPKPVADLKNTRKLVQLMHTELSTSRCLRSDTTDVCRAHFGTGFDDIILPKTSHSTVLQMTSMMVAKQEEWNFEKKVEAPPGHEHCASVLLSDVSRCVLLSVLPWVIGAFDVAIVSHRDGFRLEHDNINPADECERCCRRYVIALKNFKRHIGVQHEEL